MNQKIIEKTNTILNGIFNMTRFIDCSDFRYSISLNFAMPGFTAFDQVKKTPDINPVDNIAEAKIIISIFISQI
jgi:hypothetical protein